MKTTSLLAATLLLALGGAGCATKQYVAKTVSPVEARVSQTESKNADQDKQIAGHGTQIEELDRDLSRTKERLTDVDAKATSAGKAAAAAGMAAKDAGDKADGAYKSADNARGLAEKGMDRTVQLERTVVAMNNFQMLKSESVLFEFNQARLTKDAKSQLEEIAKTVDGKERYVIEVQGFTDNVGAAAYNESLSEMRAKTVARFLAAEYKIPVRSISLLGSGSALPVADEKTSTGRKQNRRVEVRIFVPESVAPGKTTTASTAASNN
jgi:OOP family OmpA-OmpF porin